MFHMSSPIVNSHNLHAQQNITTIYSRVYCTAPIKYNTFTSHTTGKICSIMQCLSCTSVGYLPSHMPMWASAHWKKQTGLLQHASRNTAVSYAEMMQTLHQPD